MSRLLSVCAFAVLPFFSVAVGETSSSSFEVYPTPQKMEIGTGRFAVPKQITLQNASSFDSDAKRVLAQSFQLVTRAPFVVKWSKDFSLPKEGYTLSLEKSGAKLSAADDRGLFYAVQTLRQLLASDEYPDVTIKDWPAVPFRGTVEGFYGKPWSFEARKSQFRFYGQWKMNTYIYGPKDDPFHGFSNRWRDPYPAVEAKRIAELVKTAHENKVNFVWAVHPGRDIHWKDDSDIRACIKKFEMMYKLGVRSFAVFFDDIGGEGARAEKQVELLNTVNRRFVRVKKDVTPLLLCPTQYNRAWSGGNYLDTLGKGLDADVMVMWTGNSVCCDITHEGMQWINKKLGRKAYIWWNWPVSDYCRSNLLLGKAYGCSLDNAPLYAGFVSNPMDKPEASKIPLFGVASYTWNPKAYHPDEVWRAGIRRIFPECAKSMQTFANHNSDQGPNGHGYRREESVQWADVAKRVQDALVQGKKPAIADLQSLREEFREMVHAGDDIREHCKNSVFLEETSLWLDLFVQEGKLGTILVNGLLGKIQSEKALNAELLTRVMTQNRMKRYLASAHESDRKWMHQVKTASRVMKPFMNDCVKNLRTQLWKEITGSEPPEYSAPVYRLITNVDSLKSFQINRKGTYVMLQQILEPKTLNPGDWVGISLPAGVPVTWVHFILDNPDTAKQGKIQTSTDGGKSWSNASVVVSGNGKRGEIEVRNISQDRGINAARYLNTSTKPITVTFKQFKVDVPADATANVPESMTDGSFESSYTLPAGKQIRVPLASPVTAANTKVLADGAFEISYQPNGVILKAKKRDVNIHEIVHKGLR